MIAKHIQETINSKGASVIRKMFEEGIVLKKQYGEDKVFDFSLGNPDLDPPKKVVEAILEEAKDVSHGCHGYMPNAGYPFVRNSIAKKIEKEQGVSVKGENIVMTTLEMMDSILQYWKDNNAFQRSIDERSEQMQFRFFDGPPFAS